MTGARAGARPGVRPGSQPGGPGIHLSPSSAGYPDRLRRLPVPPTELWVAGDPTCLEAPGVAVVGARAASEPGRWAAREAGAALARAGYVVVSGLARGIDAEAHRGALSVGGVTVAVLASGLDRCYPPEHRALLEEIGNTGAVVTEFPPGTAPLRYHFPRRNRIIAGLAAAVVVVEAGEKSGSLHTVRHALDLGLDVLAYPGPVDRPQCRGSNALIRDGARIVLGAADLVNALALCPELAAPDSGLGLSPALSMPPPGEMRAVWELLADGPITADDVIEGSGLGPAAALAALSSLELEGWVELRSEGCFRRREIVADVG